MYNVLFTTCDWTGFFKNIKTVKYAGTKLHITITGSSFNSYMSSNNINCTKDIKH